MCGSNAYHHWSRGTPRCTKIGQLEGTVDQLVRSIDDLFVYELLIAPLGCSTNYLNNPSIPRLHDSEVELAD